MKIRNLYINLVQIRLQSTFKASEIQFNLLKNQQTIIDDIPLQFGHQFSDHMFMVKWTSVAGWQTPKIRPLTELRLHPATRVFHYAEEIYEGLKVYKGPDSKLRLFRPGANAERMIKTAKRACLPTFDADEWEKTVIKFVDCERKFVPDCNPTNLALSSSYYVRPFMIGTDPTIGIAPSNQVLFIIIGGPVGSYFSTGFKPVSLLADPSMVRAWPGGSGYVKMGCNYAPTLMLQQEAIKKNCQQVLWLFGPDRLLTEVGTMNVFVVLRNKSNEIEMVTPPLDSGVILPGITRDSIVQLARTWEDVTMTEREISLGEMESLVKEGRLIEMFGSGTACMVCPVGEILMAEKNEKLNLLPKPGEVSLSSRAMQQLSEIQFGINPNLKPEWTVEV